MTTSTILDAFKKEFPKPNPTAMYLHPNGYLIIAPDTIDSTDYNDPFYIVSKDLQTVTRIGSRDLMKTLNAMQSAPLWER